jgi:hypothetical protein
MMNENAGVHADIFISFKNLDEHGMPTRDSALAREVYEYLTDRGLNVFLSNVSLERLGVAGYTRAIDNALDAACVLIAVGTSKQHLDSQWVRYEWNSFFNDTLSGIKPDGRLFSYIEGLEIRDLPRALRQVEVFIHGSASLERLANYICNALGKAPDKTVPSKPSSVERKVDVAYACFASSDRFKVLENLKALQAAGVRVLTELDLPAGEAWDKKIQRWIKEADFLLLFWSEAASQSKFVESEWRFALKTRGISFIRPVYIGEPGRMPQPPVELANLHFTQY